MQADDKQDSPEASKDGASQRTPVAAPAAESGRPADEAVEERPEPGLNPAEVIIRRFGGLRPMANKLEIAVSTVQGWKARGQIPHARHRDIQAAAARYAIPLTEAELAAADSAAPRGPDLRAPESRAPEPRSLEARSPRPAAGGRRAVTEEELAAEERPEAALDSEIPEEGEPAAREALLPEQRGSFLGGLLAGAAVVIFVALLVVFGRSYWLPLFEQRLPDSRYAELQQRLVQLDNRLAAVSAGGESGALRESLRRLEEEIARVSGRLAETDPMPRIEDLTRRQGDLDRRLGEFDQRLGALENGTQVLGDISRRLDDMSARLDTVAEAARQAQTLRAEHAALALALVQLREALRFSEPYDTALASLRRVAADDVQLAELLEPLAARAESGIPTLEGLRASFEEVAEKVAGIAYGEKESGWLQGVLRNLSDVVVVRPVGDVEGEGPAAIVARAEARLEAGDLGGAVALVRELEGPAAEAARPWLEEAQARQQAEAALQALTREAIERLGTAAGA